MEHQISHYLPIRAPRLAPSAAADGGRLGGLCIGALDVGGSHVTAALVGLENGGAEIRRRRSEPIDPHASAAAIVARITSAASSVGDPTHWAVAVPGPFDYPRGRGSFQGVGKFDALSGVDLRGVLARDLAVPTGALSFVNDATAYGIGEWVFGAARGHRGALCLTLGTGIGSVFLLDGAAIDKGDTVPPEGHMHRQRFRGRPIEEFVSSRAIRAHYRSLTGRESTVKEVCMQARSGDVHARHVIDTAMSVLGRSVGPWAQAFGATVIVVGGSISRAWDILEAPLRRGLTDYSESVGQRIVLAQSELMDDAPLLGAAAWLSRRL